MPQIKFTDTNLKTLSADKTIWFSDPTVKGLQLCVTAGGVKTWYVNKWDSTAQKTRRVKLGQWPPQGKHSAWAKKQVGKTAHDIDEGAIKTRQEREAERAAAAVTQLPTFREALELMIETRSNPQRIDTSGKRPMSETTIRDYRGSFNRHLATWADILVDELPVFEMATHLNALQREKREAAQRAQNVASSVIRFVAGQASRGDLMARVPRLRRKLIQRQTHTTTGFHAADVGPEHRGPSMDLVGIVWETRMSSCPRNCASGLP
ncbi:MAG: hypothetical protein CSA74_05650 [Rhodobacterales bacterium]|nr:MAG: hypothetical protein CSA74_05650 [Rhodobacterales bacterium]